ncbi:UNVERIFIED_ORG: hypothetical protein BCL66_13015 [Martelella mediterranea]
MIQQPIVRQRQNEFSGASMTSCPTSENCATTYAPMERVP